MEERTDTIVAVKGYAAILPKWNVPHVNKPNQAMHCDRLYMVGRESTPAVVHKLVVKNSHIYAQKEVKYEAVVKGTHVCLRHQTTLAYVDVPFSPPPPNVIIYLKSGEPSDLS